MALKKDRLSVLSKPLPNISRKEKPSIFKYAFKHMEEIKHRQKMVEVL